MFAEAVTWDLTVSLINATVQLDQPQGDGTRTVGTGFLIDAPRADGTPRVVLVTAGHVVERMPAQDMRIGWRVPLSDGSWRFTPAPLTIRDGEGEPLWVSHPDHDVAVMSIEAPEAFARAAIPIGWLADGYTFPTFLVDFTVFPGNSGGPVFMTGASRRRPGVPEPEHPFIAGVLTQQVEMDRERLGIGVVVHANYIREAIELLNQAERAAEEEEAAEITAE